MSERLVGNVPIATGAGSRGPGLGNDKAPAILIARAGARALCVDAQKVARGGNGRPDPRRARRGAGLLRCGPGTPR